MKSFTPVYVPVGVPTFHLESAQRQFDLSAGLLRSIDERFAVPEKMLLSIDDLRAFLDSVSPDLIVFQNLTFANAAYMSEVLRRFDCPMLLWTLREPVIDGGRLRLNSLTGAYSAANTLRAFDERSFEYLFGSPEEERVKDALSAVVRAAAVKKEMRSLKMSAVGHTPQGFGFGRALDGELMNAFGVELEAIEARELIEKARGYTDEECAVYLEKTAQATCGLDKTPENNRLDHARLLKAYSDYVREHGIFEGVQRLRARARYRRAGLPLLAGFLHRLRHARVHRAVHAQRRGRGRRLRGRHLRRAVDVDRHAPERRAGLLRRPRLP